ncbi:esterase-like activity of phytase family protein [Oleiagrimonas sp. C23AA]|nr:esterase-like activity of phytase family protein [Oleiagrimonas sp. C23AA]
MLGVGGTLLSAPAAAQVHLIAQGRLASGGGDKAANTAAPLENGVAGNRLGGLGSALAYAGCDTFLALPDRGPNAKAWNAALDNTDSYITRFQTLRLTLHATPHDAHWPFRLQPALRQTTLLWSSSALVYGPGAAPVLNRAGHDYFTGRSDGFSADHASDWPADARLDPESLRISNDGRTLYIGDEYGPHLYRFDRQTGRRLGVIKLPAWLAVAHPAPTGHAETHHNRQGRVGNHGLEGLAISPDGTVLFGAMQGALIQDGGNHGAYARLLRIDLRSGRVQSFAYPLTRTSGRHGHARYSGISEIVAVNDHQLLVDERDGGGLGGKHPARVKRIYEVDLAGATPLGQAHGQAALGRHALGKHLFVDLVKRLGAHGVTPAQVPEKIEGMAFGPDVRWQGKAWHTLYVSTDNDFLDRVDGKPNPDRFFVLAFAPSDLPGYRAQQRAAACRRGS